MTNGNSKITPAAAARIQAAEAKTNDGKVSKGSFAARAQAAATTAAKDGGWPSKTPGKPSGTGRRNN